MKRRAYSASGVLVATWKEVSTGIVVTGFVWWSLFDRRLPTEVQSRLFWVVLVLEIAMIVAGWALCSKARNDTETADWRKDVGFAGMLSNTLAIAIPIGFLLSMIFRPYMTPLDGSSVRQLCLICSFCGLAAGLFAPARSRLVTVLGAVIGASMMLSIPMAIL